MSTPPVVRRTRPVSLLAALCIAAIPATAQRTRAVRPAAAATTRRTLALSDAGPESGVALAPARVAPLSASQKMQVLSESVPGASSGGFAWQTHLSASHPIDGMHRFELHDGILMPAPDADGEIVFARTTQLVVRLDVKTSKQPLLLDCAVWNPQPLTWKVGTRYTSQTMVLGSGAQHLTMVLLPSKTGLFGFGISVEPPGRVFDGAALQSCEISQYSLGTP